MNTTLKFSYNNFRKMVMRSIAPKRVGDNVFSVNSTSDEKRAYLITTGFRGNLLDVRCQCKAGQEGKPCCHALSVVHAMNADTRLIPQRKTA